MTIQLTGLNGRPVDLPADALQAFKAAFKGQLLGAGRRRLRRGAQDLERDDRPPARR